MSFPEQVRFLLSSRGLSINKMLKDLSLGSGTFATWEKNNRTPTGDVLARLADYFDVTTDYLLGRTDQKELSASDERPLRSTLLHNFDQLNQEGQEKLVDLSDDMVSSGKYIKSDTKQLGKAKNA